MVQRESQGNTAHVIAKLVTTKKNYGNQFNLFSVIFLQACCNFWASINAE